MSCAVFAVVVVELVGPEVEAVDVAMGEPKTAVVLVVVCLGLDVGTHRVAAGDNRAVMRPNRVQIWLGSLGAIVEGGELLSAQQDLDLILPLAIFDFAGGAR